MEIDLLCVGTPHIVGDSIGPLIGSILSNCNLDVNVVGTMEAPVIMSTYSDSLKRLRPNAFVIVIDATLGHSIGTYSIERGSLQPGAALNQGITPVGDLAIKCYTGSSIYAMVIADVRDVATLAFVIINKLMDLLTTNKIKDIYSNII